MRQSAFAKRRSSSVGVDRGRRPTRAGTPVRFARQFGGIRSTVTVDEIKGLDIINVAFAEATVASSVQRRRSAKGE
jgi:hypothetical protein